MWATFVGAVLASLLGDEESEQERLAALGLGRQLDLIRTSPADDLVLLRGWSDGASLWRIVGWPAYAAVERSIEKEVRPKWKGGEYDLAQQVEAGCDPMTVDVDLVAYAYLEGQGASSRPVALVLVNGGTLSQIELAHDLPKNSRVTERLYKFLGEERENLENADSEHWDLLWGKAATVPDLAVDTLARLREVLGQGSEGKEIYEPLFDSQDHVVRAVGRWAEAYSELWWAVKQMDATIQERERWASADKDDPWVRQEIEELGTEEVSRIYAEESKDRWGRRTPFDAFREARIDSLDEELRELLKGELSRKADEEASLAQKLLWQLEVNSKEGKGDLVERWELKRPWDSRYSDPVDTVILRWGERDCDYDLQEGHVGGPVQTIGVLETLLQAGLAERLSAREKRVGEPAWSWPGKELQGVWELLALVEDYKPSLDDPFALFLKVSFDHGLLSGPATKRFEKLLREWEDPTSKMEENGIRR